MCCGKIPQRTTEVKVLGRDLSEKLEFIKAGDKGIPEWGRCGCSARLPIPARLQLQGFS
jgi:hypothetical protein